MIRFLVIIVLAFTAFSFSIDEPFKAIVLINGQAYLVDVTSKGDIITTYQKINNYFSSSESHDSMITRLSKGAVSDGGSIVFYELQEEPVPSFTEENKRPIETGSNQYIGFSPDKAILLKAAVDQIRKIADGYRLGVVSAVQITSYHRNDFRSKSLSRNRAKAIKDLLQAFGVPDSLIETISIEGSRDVKVDFVNIGFGN